MMTFYEYDDNRQKKYIKNILLMAAGFGVPSALVFIIYGLRSIGMDEAQQAYSMTLLLLPFVYYAYMPGLSGWIGRYNNSKYRYLKVKADHREHKRK